MRGYKMGTSRSRPRLGGPARGGAGGDERAHRRLCRGVEGGRTNDEVPEAAVCVSRARVRVLGARTRAAIELRGASRE